MAQTSWWRWTCIFLTFTLFVYFGASQSSYVNQEDWVDPDDIMNYDSVSKTMIKPDHSRSSSSEWVDPSEPDCPMKCCAKLRTEVTYCEERRSKCEDNLLVLQESRQTCQDVDKISTLSRNTQPNPVKAVETMYMKRFTNILLRVSGLTGAVTKPEEGVIVKHLLMAVESEQLMALRRFGSDDKMTLGDLDEVLSKVLQSTESGYQIPVPVEWIDYLKHFFSSKEIFLHLTSWAIVLVPVLMLTMQCSFSKVVKMFLCLVLLLGYQMKFTYMVKMAEVDQLLTPPPPECRPDLMSWWESLRYALLGDADACRRHHVAATLPPAMAVTPTLVLANLLADVIARPMEALGRGVGGFSLGIWNSLPWYVSLVILPLALVWLGAVAVAMVAVQGGGSVGNMMFSFTGGRQRGHEIGGRRPSTELAAAPNAGPNVLHVVHHDARGPGPGPGPAGDSAPPPPPLWQRMLGMDRPPRRLPLPDLWINEAVAIGGSVRTSDRFASRDVAETNAPLAEQRPLQPPGRRRANTARRKHGGGGGGSTVEPSSDPQRLPGAQRSADDSGQRPQKRDSTASVSREAVVLREIQSLLSDALLTNAEQKQVVEKSTVRGIVSTDKKRGRKESLQTLAFEKEMVSSKDKTSSSKSQVLENTGLRQLEQEVRLEQRRSALERMENKPPSREMLKMSTNKKGMGSSKDKTSPSLSQVLKNTGLRQLELEVRLEGSRVAAAGSSDFLSQLVDALGNESPVASSTGNDSSVTESEFMTSIQNIMNEEDDVVS